MTRCVVIKKSCLALMSVLVSFASICASFKFKSQSSTIQLSGPAAKIILSTPLTEFDGTLKILEKNQNSIQATTTSDILNFAGGVYQSSNSGRTFITATLDPSFSDTIILSSGQEIEFENGSVIESILITGTGNKIFGQPSFNGTIGLQNSFSDVTFSIQNKLNQNVNLNGGTVILGNDLSLQEGVFFVGSGTVDINSNRLVLPGTGTSSWNNSLIFVNASDLNLTGLLQLNGAWTFAGAAVESRIAGSGNILDLSGGGQINIDNDSSLYISDLVIRGLGSDGGTINIAQTGKLYLTNVTIELAGTFVLPSGKIIVQGNNCVIVTRNHALFNVTNTGILTLDGVALLYDPLGTSPLFPVPIQALSGGIISQINNGVIRANYYVDGSSGNTEINPALIASSNIGLIANFTLNASSNITFINDNISVPRTIEFDGKGFFLQFNYSTGRYISIDENLTVVFKNIYLKDFDPELIKFGGSGASAAKILFDDGVILSLSKDLTLTHQPLSFSGNAKLRGNNSTLYLNSDAMLTQGVDDKELTIQSLRLVMGHETGMSCLTDNSKIVLQDSSINMLGIGYSFNSGHLDIKNEVMLSGADATNATAVSTFTFASKGFMTVLPAAIFKISPNATFNYNPDISSDPDALVFKRHFLLSDLSSTLWLDYCNFNAGAMGVAFDHGRMIVDGNTVFKMDTAVGAELEFGTALIVELAPGGVLDVDGVLKYSSTTYP